MTAIILIKNDFKSNIVLYNNTFSIKIIDLYILLNYAKKTYLLLSVIVHEVIKYSK